MIKIRTLQDTGKQKMAQNHIQFSIVKIYKPIQYHQNSQGLKAWRLATANLE